MKDGTSIEVLFQGTRDPDLWTEQGPLCEIKSSLHFLEVVGVLQDHRRSFSTGTYLFPITVHTRLSRAPGDLRSG